MASYDKYRRPAWICNTYNLKGKQACASQQIPERILDEKTRAVLGIPEITMDAVREHVQRIIAHNGGRLTYILLSGETIDVLWENPSRRESWNEAMRVAAREAAQRRYPS